jgi:flagellar biosynthetic protein FliR
MRCAGLLAAFPQALGMSVPAPIRGLAAAALALVLAPLAPHPHALTLGGALGEMLLGAALGFCLRLPIFAAQAAGEAVGFTTYASSFMMQGLPEDAGGGGNIWSSAYTQVGLLAYFGVGGPQSLVEAMAGSMRLAHLGGAGFPASPAVGDLVGVFARMAFLALVLCAPPLLASLGAQWALGLVFRASARLQLYSFALPLASLAAAGVLALSLPSWPGLIQKSLGWSLESAAGLAAAAGGRP